MLSRYGKLIYFCKCNLQLSIPEVPFVDKILAVYIWSSPWWGWELFSVSWILPFNRGTVWKIFCFWPFEFVGQSQEKILLKCCAFGRTWRERKKDKMIQPRLIRKLAMSKTKTFGPPHSNQRWVIRIQQQFAIYNFDS